jgi:hypothetical protein
LWQFPAAGPMVSNRSGISHNFAVACNFTVA